jgi:hypothetical protein
MLRYLTAGLGVLLLAAGLLVASPAQARHRTRRVRYHTRHPSTVRVYTTRVYTAPYGRAYGYRAHNPPYGRAYGYRAHRADRNRDSIPDYLERSPRVYRQRVAGWRRSYRDSDRDGVPDYRDRYPHNRWKH